MTTPPAVAEVINALEIQRAAIDAALEALRAVFQLDDDAAEPPESKLIYSIDEPYFDSPEVS